MDELKGPKKQWPQARSIRLTKELDARCEEYLRKNAVNFNMLVRLALDEFISVERTVTLEVYANVVREIWERICSELQKGVIAEAVAAVSLHHPMPESVARV